MEDLNIIYPMLETLIFLNIDYIRSIYESLMSSFGIFLRAFFVLYTVWTGYKWYKAEVKESAYNLILSWILIAAIHSSVLEFNWYSSFVIKNLVNLTMDISAFFISATQKMKTADSLGNLNDVQSAFQGLDQMSATFFTAIWELSPKGNWVTNAWRYITYAIAMIPLFCLYLAMYASFFVIFGMAMFSMFIFFIFGGICFLFGAFKETRHVFFTWMRGVANYMLLAIFAAIIMSICSHFLADAIVLFKKQAESEGILAGPYLRLFVWCAFGLAMTLKSPDFAAHMTGTMAGSTSGIAGAISAGTSALGGGMFAASKVTGGAVAAGAGKVGSWAGSKMMGGAANALDALKASRNAK